METQLLAVARVEDALVAMPWLPVVDHHEVMLHALHLRPPGDSVSSHGVAGGVHRAGPMVPLLARPGDHPGEAALPRDDPSSGLLLRCAEWANGTCGAGAGQRANRRCYVRTSVALVRWQAICCRLTPAQLFRCCCPMRLTRPLTLPPQARARTAPPAPTSTALLASLFVVTTWLAVALGAPFALSTTAAVRM